MLAKCYSGAINGAESSTVEIEVYSAKGTSSFAIVGLPDTAVKEAKDRVSTALKNSGYRSKDEYAVTVNLAPADVKKEGPIYDLPIAICLLKATQRLRTEDAQILAELQARHNTKLTFVSELHRHPETYSILDAESGQVLYSSGAGRPAV